MAAIAALDDSYARGELDESDYRARRGDLAARALGLEAGGGGCWPRGMLMPAVPVVMATATLMPAVPVVMATPMAIVMVTPPPMMMMVTPMAMAV